MVHEGDAVKSLLSLAFFEVPLAGSLFEVQEGVPLEVLLGVRMSEVSGGDLSVVQSCFGGGTGLGGVAVM